MEQHGVVMVGEGQGRAPASRAARTSGNGVGAVGSPAQRVASRNGWRSRIPCRGPGWGEDDHLPRAPRTGPMTQIMKFSDIFSAPRC